MGVRVRCFCNMVELLEVLVARGRGTNRVRVARFCDCNDRQKGHYFTANIEKKGRVLTDRVPSRACWLLMVVR